MMNRHMRVLAVVAAVAGLVTLVAATPLEWPDGEEFNCKLQYTQLQRHLTACMLLKYMGLCASSSIGCLQLGCAHLSPPHSTIWSSAEPLVTSLGSPLY